MRIERRSCSGFILSWLSAFLAFFLKLRAWKRKFRRSNMLDVTYNIDQYAKIIQKPLKMLDEIFDSD